jgi:RNase P/RNase MRP subunit p30
MYDIIKCKTDAKVQHSEQFYIYENVKSRIITVKNFAEAAQKRKQKKLIIVEDCSIDEGAIKLLGEEQRACILIDLSRILKNDGVRRAIEFSVIRTMLKLCIKHGAFYTFATFAEKEEDIRTIDELCHIGMLLGLNRGQGKFALKMIEDYLQ